jgi:hypothetical protein
MFHGGGGQLGFAFVSLALIASIVGVIAGRRTPDDASIRPRAIYLSAAMLPALVIGVLSAARFLEALVRLILGPESPKEALAGLGGGRLGDLIGGGGLGGMLGDSGGAGGLGDLAGLLAGLGEGLDPTDAVIRTLVASGITAIVAFAIYRLHVDWRRSVTDADGFVGSAAARVFQAVAYTVVLIFVVLFALAVVKAGYGVFRAVAPGTSAALAISETAEREQGIADIVTGVALAAASLWLLFRAWDVAATWRGETSPGPAAPPPAG